MALGVKHSFQAYARRNVLNGLIQPQALYSLVEKKQIHGSTSRLAIQWVQANSSVDMVRDDSGPLQ